MINSANICIFEGRICKDPSISNIQGANGVIQKALFTIAVDRAMSSEMRQRAKNGDGSIKTTDFVPCSLIGGQVEVLAKYFSKGKGIRVIGHYQEYQTTDKQTGETRYGHTFAVDNIGFCIQDPKNMQNNGYQNGNDYGNNGYQNNNNGYQNNQNQQYNNNQTQVNYNNKGSANPPAPQEQFSMFDESASPF